MPFRRPILLGLIFLVVALVIWSTALIRPGGKKAGREAVSVDRVIDELVHSPVQTGSSGIAERMKIIDQVAKLLPPDSRESNHPVERAVSSGEVLATRLEQVGPGQRWRRIRLVRADIQPRLLRVVEDWEVDLANGAAVCLRRDMFLADQLIVRAKDGVDESALRERLKAESMAIEQTIGRGLFTVRLGRSDLDASPDAIAALGRHRDLVDTAEPDGVGFGGGVPNDALFSEQWGNHNTGQSGGTIDADVDAPEFWDTFGHAPDVVVAVLDSGLNFTHPDLQGIVWANPGEISGDGIDNDGNGRIDDVRGWDFVNNDNDPVDDHAHGSHVTGILAANRDNGAGIAGMLTGVKIMVCKILNSTNSGTTSNLIAATTYARLKGVPVMNLSLQNYPFNSTLNTEFDACQTAGIVLAICAGNQGVNNDTTPNYPSSYPQTNIIAVGNHNRNDVRSSSSNYGATNVDLFAPGDAIRSTVLGTNYQDFSGTSMATPYVAAVSAMLKQLNPSWNASQIKTRVQGTVVTVSSYNGISSTGGRLNALAAMPASPAVTSPSSTSITSAGATLGGNVTSAGSSSVTERGFVYAATSVNANPLIGGIGVTKVVVAGSTGAFSVPVAGLSSATSYTFRAYATNATGTGYSASSSFSTLSANANLSGLTLSAGSLSPSFAPSTISYAASAGKSVTAITVTPTASDPAAKLEVRINGGSFAIVPSNNPSQELPLSLGNNLVYVRVTAPDNVTQRTYQISFTRRAEPSVSFSTVSGRTASGAILGGNVTSDGGSTVTERGVVFSAISVNLSPSIGGPGVTKVAVPGTTGIFTVDVTGLNHGTGYVFKPYATNGEGTGYGSVTSFTTLSSNANLGTLTFQGSFLSPTFSSGIFIYGGSVAGSVESIVFTPTASQANAVIEARVNGGAFTAVASGGTSAALSLMPGANDIEIRVTAQDGETQRTYLVTIVRRTTPVVINPERRENSANSALLAAVVSADGGDTVLERGFVLVPASGGPLPAVGGDGVIQISAGAGLGAFEATADNLDPGTRYLVRAYAENSEGFAYTATFSFVTDAILSLPSMGGAEVLYRDIEPGEIQRLRFSLQGERFVTIRKSGVETLVVLLKNGDGDVVRTIAGDGEALVEAILPSGDFVFEIENNGGQSELFSLSVQAESPAPDVSAGASAQNLVGRFYRGSVTIQQAPLISSRLRTVRGAFAVGNLSRSPDRMVLSGTKGTRLFLLRYLAPEGDVSASVILGRYLTSRTSRDDQPVLLDLSIRPNRAGLTKKSGNRLLVKRTKFLISLRAVAETDRSAEDAAACKVMTR